MTYTHPYDLEGLRVCVFLYVSKVSMFDARSHRTIASTLNNSYWHIAHLKAKKEIQMKNELPNTHIIPLSIIKQHSIFNCLGFECGEAESYNSSGIQQFSHILN